MKDRVAALVERLGRPRVFVLGDLILDRYLWGAVNRVSPEAPVPVLNVAREEYRAGGASNVVVNLAAAVISSVSSFLKRLQSSSSSLPDFPRDDLHAPLDRSLPALKRLEGALSLAI